MNHQPSIDFLEIEQMPFDQFDDNIQKEFPKSSMFNFFGIQKSGLDVNNDSTHQIEELSVQNSQSLQVKPILAENYEMSEFLSEKYRPNQNDNYLSANYPLDDCGYISPSWDHEMNFDECHFLSEEKPLYGQTQTNQLKDTEFNPGSNLVINESISRKDNQPSSLSDKSLSNNEMNDSEAKALTEQRIQEISEIINSAQNQGQLEDSHLSQIYKKAAQRYSEENKPKVNIRNPFQPYEMKKHFEEINKISFAKYSQEINNHKNRGESLQGKIFDKVLNKFVKKCNDPYLNRHIKFDQRFFLKKGSVFSRMDAEIELLLHEQALKKKMLSKAKDQIIYCQEAVGKTEKDFIKPGNFTFSEKSYSPCKFFPRRPNPSSVASSKQDKQTSFRGSLQSVDYNKEIPDCEIIEEQVQNKALLIEQPKKIALITPEMVYNQLRVINLEDDEDLQMKKSMKLKQNHLIYIGDSDTENKKKRTKTLESYKSRGHSQAQSKLVTNDDNEEEEGDIFSQLINERAMKLRQSKLQKSLEELKQNEENLTEIINKLNNVVPQVPQTSKTHQHTENQQQEKSSLSKDAFIESINSKPKPGYSPQQLPKGVDESIASQQYHHETSGPEKRKRLQKLQEKKSRLLSLIEKKKARVKPQASKTIEINPKSKVKGAKSRPNDKQPLIEKPVKNLRKRLYRNCKQQNAQEVKEFDCDLIKNQEIESDFEINIDMDPEPHQLPDKVLISDQLEQKPHEQLNQQDQAPLDFLDNEKDHQNYIQTINKELKDHLESQDKLNDYNMDNIDDGEPEQYQQELSEQMVVIEEIIKEEARIVEVEGKAEVQGKPDQEMVEIQEREEVKVVVSDSSGQSSALKRQRRGRKSLSKEQKQELKVQELSLQERQLETLDHFVRSNSKKKLVSPHRISIPPSTGFMLQPLIPNLIQNTFQKCPSLSQNGEEEQQPQKQESFKITITNPKIVNEKKKLLNFPENVIIIEPPKPKKTSRKPTTKKEELQKLIPVVDFSSSSPCQEINVESLLRDPTFIITTTVLDLKQEKEFKKLEEQITKQFYEITSTPKIKDYFKLRINLKKKNIQYLLKSFILGITPFQSSIEKVIVEKNYRFEIFVEFNFALKTFEVKLEDKYPEDDEFDIEKSISIPSIHSSQSQSIIIDSKPSTTQKYYGMRTRNRSREQLQNEKSLPQIIITAQPAFNQLQKSHKPSLLSEKEESSEQLIRPSQNVSRAKKSLLDPDDQTSNESSCNVTQSTNDVTSNDECATVKPRLIGF